VVGISIEESVIIDCLTSFRFFCAGVWTLIGPKNKKARKHYVSQAFENIDLVTSTSDLPA
jgi:hypothetical protein